MIVAADEAGCFAAGQTTKNDGLPHGDLRHPDNLHEMYNLQGQAYPGI